MSKRFIASLAICLFAVFASSSLYAQQDTTELARIKRQLDALTREIEALRLGDDVVVQADTSNFGFGPAASKVYRAKSGVSVGGYGEVLYQNFAEKRENDALGNVRDNVDALRLITYVGYKFSPKFLFNSEVEFEHANTATGGVVEVEFAYIDYVASPKLGLRAGLLLVPMGFINELHEPPIYLGTTRPTTENAIIPTTWRDNGFGVFGDAGPLSYRAYVIAGLDAIGSTGRATGFSATGLRGGRQHGAFSLIENVAFVARLDYSPSALAGVMVGASAYTGKSGQSAKTSAGQAIDAATTILEGHAQYKAHGLDLRGLYAHATVDDAALINAARNLTGANSVAEHMAGWYVQAGYDVLSASGREMELTPYVRFESLNTQEEVPTGFTAAPANDRTITSIGAQLKPISKIVLKADYQIHKNEAKTGLSQFNIALGYLF